MLQLILLFESGHMCSMHVLQLLRLLGSCACLSTTLMWQEKYQIVKQLQTIMENLMDAHLLTVKQCNNFFQVQFHFALIFLGP